MTATCEICGSGSMIEKHGDYEHTWPEAVSSTPSVIQGARWFECSNCGERLLPPELRRGIGAERYRVEDLLTPGEIRGIRSRYVLRQRDISALLRIGDRTYTRWENGLVVQSKSMNALLRVLAALGPERFREIQEGRAPAPAEAACEEACSATLARWKRVVPAALGKGSALPVARRARSGRTRQVAPANSRAQGTASQERKAHELTFAA